MAWGGPRGRLHGVSYRLFGEHRLHPAARRQGKERRFGPGGFGPFGGQERKLVKDFDKNSDGWLNKEERSSARDSLKNAGGFGGKGFAMKGGFGRGEPGQARAEGQPRPRSRTTPTANLYDPTGPAHHLPGVRERGLGDGAPGLPQHRRGSARDADVDGKKYPNVGVHFRGMSSYMGVPAGSKRSLNVSLDMADAKQRLYGYKTLNLLNSHDDASLMSSVLYSHIARQYIPAPKANFVKVVINGESWGVYASVQQFDKEFLDENFKTTKGTRWKVRGSPGGARRAGVPRRRHRGLQAPLRDQVRTTTRRPGRRWSTSARC